jgi:protein involved in polysaccharide export with SLBB domain
MFFTGDTEKGRRMKHNSALFIMIWVAVTYASIIRSGDVVEITVKDHQEFSGRFTVNEQGLIDYPLLADIPIASITTSELMNDLTFRLARHIDNPLVLVSIVEKPEIVVRVLGEVKVPGPVTSYDGVTLQEVLQGAGGPLPTADLTSIKIVRGEKMQSSEYFDLEEFLKDGDIHAMPRLNAEDIVILLAKGKTEKVKIIGAVNKPGFYALEDTMNIFEAIYLAGGPAEKADMSRIRRFFKIEEKTMEEVIDIQAYIDKGDMDNIPLVSEGEVIIVYSKWFDWKTMLSILNNVLLFLVTIQALAGFLK